MKDTQDQKTPETNVNEKTFTNSSQVRWAKHDSTTNTLFIEFKSSGKIYRYEGVAQKTWDGMMAAPSIGSYVQTHIVRAGYKYSIVKASEAR